MAGLSRDVVVGVLLLAASVWYYYTASQLPISLIDTTVNSSQLPKLLGMLGAGLSLVLIAQALLRQLRAAKPAAEPDAGETPVRPMMQHMRAFGIVAIAVLYVLLLNLLGYVLAIGLTIWALSAYQSAFYNTRRPIWTALALSAAGALCFWAIFDKLLGIRMPVGIVWRHLS